MANYSIDDIEKAKDFYLQGYSIRKIAELMNIPAHCTVDGWKTKYKWKKAKPDYPINSLKAQLERVTKLVDTLEPELEKIDVLKPTPEQKELLSNFRRFSELQLKLIKQLGVLQPIDRRPAKKNIFL
jgi:hypothetical protein